MCQCAPHTQPHEHSSCHEFTGAAHKATVVCAAALSYCADDWLLKFYFAAREVTNSISGLRPVTLEMEKKTAEAEAEVKRLKDKQQQIVKKTEERKASSDGDSAAAGAGSGSSSSVSAGLGSGEEEEDESAVDESEGAGSMPLPNSGSEQQPQAQKKRGGDVDGYGIENWDLTGVVDGHTDYPNKIHEILDILQFRP